MSCRQCLCQRYCSYVIIVLCIRHCKWVAHVNLSINGDDDVCQVWSRRTWQHQRPRLYPQLQTHRPTDLQYQWVDLDWLCRQRLVWHTTTATRTMVWLFTLSSMWIIWFDEKAPNREGSAPPPTFCYIFDCKRYILVHFFYRITVTVK